MDSIQIFACDHRHDAQWDLPYMRFGGPESTCAIKTPSNSIFDMQVNADETPKLFWLWKNIKELGSPDIIGYCQYRRFFTKCHAGNYPLVNIPASDFKLEFAMTPLEQLMLIRKNGVDGILHPAFKVVDGKVCPHEFIWEQIYILTNEDMLKLKHQKLAFDLLLKHTPDALKEHMQKAFHIKENYLCNIFTCKSKLFIEFGKTAFNAVHELLSMMSEDERSSLHPYWLAYLFERYTSCWHHALELSGKHKFLKVPLMTIDAHKHIEWKRQ